MDINLLSTNLIVYLSLATAALATSIIFGLDKSWKKFKYFNPKPVAIIAPAVVLGVIFQVIIWHLFPGQQLPQLWEMVLPFTLSLCLVFPAWTSKKKWLKPISTLSVLAGFVFSFVIINSYYSFYPTLFSVFTSDATNIVAEQNKTTAFNPKPADKKQSSIESKYFDFPTNGTISSLKIPGKVSGFKPRTELLYTPAIAKFLPQIKLPVVVLIPGTPGTTYNWLQTDLKKTADNFAAKHHGITPYLFMLDDSGSLTNDTECTNSRRGNVETYLTVDVPNYIKSHFKNVETGPQNWAIGGLSMGGACSAMLVLRHPNVYRDFLDFGGEGGIEVGTRAHTIATLFRGSAKSWEQHQPMWLLSHYNYRKYNIGAYIAIGDQDRQTLISENKDLYKGLKKAGITSVFDETKGSHTFRAWSISFKTALPWISNRLGATSMQKN